MMVIDATPEAGLLAARPAAAVGGARQVQRLDLAAQLEGLALVHDEDGLEPFAEARVPVDVVRVGGALQQLDLNSESFY